MVLTGPRARGTRFPHHHTPSSIERALSKAECYLRRTEIPFHLLLYYVRSQLGCVSLESENINSDSTSSLDSSDCSTQKLAPFPNQITTTKLSNFLQKGHAMAMYMKIFHGPGATGTMRKIVSSAAKALNRAGVPCVLWDSVMADAFGIGFKEGVSVSQFAI